MSEFVECASCAAKPGSPVLCTSCLQNRAAISALQSRLHTAEQSVIGAAQIGMDEQKRLTTLLGDLERRFHEQGCRLHPWVNAAERVPDHCVNVLVSCEHYDDLVTAWYSDADKTWNDEHGLHVRGVTHWMELPEPPK